MRAVARLVWTYFAGTPLTRWLAVAGVLVYASAAIVFSVRPYWTIAVGTPGIGWFLLLVSPWLALLLIFASSALLPVVFGRLAFSRQIRILPHGKGRLLASAVAAPFLMACSAAGLAVLVFKDFPAEMQRDVVAVRALAAAFLNFSVMYLAAWVRSRMQSGLAVLVGALLVLASAIYPLAAIMSPSGGLAWLAYAVMVFWGVAAVAYLSSRRWMATWTLVIARVPDQFLAKTSLEDGAEVETMLATRRPWIVAIGQIVPIAAASALLLVESWLFSLTLCAIISGAVTSRAASRARSLWLHSGSTRDELFRRVEKAYLNYNAYAWLVLFAIYAGMVFYLRLPAGRVVLGAPLLILGGAASTYLGLMMTKRLGWAEIVAVVVTMSLLMAAAGFVSAKSASVPLALTAGIEVLVGALALAFRSASKRRWHSLDWMVCRREAPA